MVDFADEELVRVSWDDEGFHEEWHRYVYVQESTGKLFVPCDVFMPREIGEALCAFLGEPCVNGEGGALFIPTTVVELSHPEKRERLDAFKKRIVEVVKRDTQ